MGVLSKFFAKSIEMIEMSNAKHFAPKSVTEKRKGWKKKLKATSATSADIEWVETIHRYARRTFAKR